MYATPVDNEKEKRSILSWLMIFPQEVQQHHSYRNYTSGNFLSNVYLHVWFAGLWLFSDYIVEVLD
jgi:hypothetical protein